MEYSSYPKLYDTRLLWHCSYYDGPINGVLEYKGQRYWFSTCDENFEEYSSNDEEVCWYRRYTVHELIPEQLKDAQDNHDLFEMHVRTSTYTEEGKPLDGPCKPKENWKLYYDHVKGKSKLDYSHNPIIGWFER